MRKLTKTSRTALFLLLFSIVIFTGVVFAAGELIPRFLVGSGGWLTSTQNLELRSAVGQPIAGTVGEDLKLCSGFH